MDKCTSSYGDFNMSKGGLEINVSAPGKVILHGEHAVVYGKKAVAAALGLRSRLKIVEIQQPNVIVFDIRPFQFVHSFKISDIQELWSNSSMVTSNISDFNITTTTFVNFESLSKKVDQLIENLLSQDVLQNNVVITSLKCLLFLLSSMKCSLNLKLTSLAVRVESELQIGAGTGSSASFSVCVAAGLLQYFKLKSSGLVNISKDGFKPFVWENPEMDNLNSFSQRQLDMICQWSFLGEKIFHGTPSGIDNTVCTYGNMVEFRKGETPIHIRLKTTFDLLLINTNVSRNTARLVAKVANFRSEFPVLVDKILDCIETVTLTAIELTRKLDSLEADEATEVNSSSNEAFSKNFQNLTWLSQMNHIFLMSLGVSHPKLQEIITILEKHNLNGKLTGAGGGGFAIALLRPDFDAAKVMGELKKSGFGVFRTKLGGEGVTLD